MANRRLRDKSLLANGLEELTVTVGLKQVSRFGTQVGKNGPSTGDDR